MRKAVVRIVVVALAVLVLLEVGVRAAAPRLPEPETWYHPSAQVKVEQMDALAGRGERVDVVLGGTSQMAEGADPVLFGRLAAGRPSTYNAAVLAGYPSVNERFLPEEVVPRLHPTTVIYGVSVTDLIPATDPPYDEARATNPTVWGALDRFVSQYSYLLRYRTQLRDPEVWGLVAAGGGGGRVEFYRSEAIGERGRWEEYGSPACHPPAAGPVPERADEVLDPSHVESYWATVRRLRAEGVRVVVAVMPFPDCYLGVPSLGATVRLGRQAIAERAAAEGVPLIDVSGELTDDALFSDSGHLAPAGAERFTTLLAAAYDELPPS